MLREGLNGFCMALADIVPGVSGGTIAFILGFYDRFIGSINDFVFGKMEKKKSALVYLAKLGMQLLKEHRNWKAGYFPWWRLSEIRK